MIFIHIYIAQTWSLDKRAKSKSFNTQHQYINAANFVGTIHYIMYLLRSGLQEQPNMAQAKSSLQCEQWIGDTVKKNYKTRCIIHQQNIVSSFVLAPISHGYCPLRLVCTNKIHYLQNRKQYHCTNGFIIEAMATAESLDHANRVPSL